MKKAESCCWSPPKLSPFAPAHIKLWKKTKQLHPGGLRLLGSQLTCLFDLVPLAFPVLRSSAAEGNMNAPETFNFLVERCVAFDFGRGRASYSDIFP